MHRPFPRLSATIMAALLFVAAPLMAQTPTHDKAIDDFNFAAWLYNQGKYPLAGDAYKAFLDAFPQHAKVPDARFGFAQALFYQDKFQEAAAAYESLHQATPDFSQKTEERFQLAQCRVALNQFKEAEKLFGEVRQQHGDHYLADWAAARQAACLINLEQYKAGEDLLRLFLDTYSPGDKPAADAPATRELFSKLDQAGIKAQDAFLSLVERSAFYLGIAQVSQNRPADAQPAFERFLRQYPKSTLRDEAQFRLAQCRYQQQAYAAAAEAYRAAAVGTNAFAEDAAFELGLALYKDGKLKQSSAAFDDMAVRFPQNIRAAQARLYAGMFLFEAGDPAGAEVKLQPLAEGNQDGTGEAAYWLGMCQLRQNRAADAEARFAVLLKDHPDSVRAGDARLGLGDALLAQDKPADAAKAFRDYAEKSPQADQAPRALYSACVALHRTDHYDESDALCGDFVTRYATNELAPQVVFLSGENRFLGGKPDQAAARYRELRERPDASKENIVRAHFRLAWIARDKHQFEDALKELKAMDPAEAGEDVGAEARYLEGVCLAESGKADQAVGALEAYLKHGGARRYGDDALLRLAAAYAGTARKPKAAETYARFLKEYPQSELAPQARYQLAECDYDARQYDRAVKHYQAVLAAQPKGELAPYAAFGIGQCRADQEQWAPAADGFAALVKDHPDSTLVPQAIYRQARCRMSLKQWPEAGELLRTLLKDFPKHELARAAQMSLGYCLEEQKLWADAAGAFRDTVDKFPGTNDLPRLYYEQAWSWREAGKPDEALRAFRALAEKFPGDALAADANFHLAEASYTAATAEGVPADSRARQLAEARPRYALVLTAADARQLADKAHYRLGWTWWLVEDYAKAAAEFDQVKEHFPGSDLLGDCLFQAGQSYAKAGQPALALERYRALLDDGKFETYTFRPDAVVGLGDCLISLGKPEEAVKELASMTRAHPDHSAAAQAYFLMGKAEYDRGRFAEAIKSFDAVTGRTQGDVAARAQFYIGQALQAQAQWKPALVAYLRVQAIYPQEAEWVAAATCEAGTCHEALGEDEDARKGYRDVIGKSAESQWGKLAAERLAKLSKP